MTVAAAAATGADTTAVPRDKAATEADITAGLKVRAEGLRIHKIPRIPEEKGVRTDDITEKS